MKMMRTITLAGLGLLALAALLGWVLYAVSPATQSQGPIVVGFDMIIDDDADTTPDNFCPGLGNAGGTDCTLGPIDDCAAIANGDSIEFDVVMQDLPSGEDIAGADLYIGWPVSPFVFNVTAQSADVQGINIIADDPDSSLICIGIEGVPDAVSPHYGTCGDLGGVASAEANPPFTQGILFRFTAQVGPGVPAGTYGLYLTRPNAGIPHDPVLGNVAALDLCLLYGCTKLDYASTPPYGIIAVDVPCGDRDGDTILDDGDGSGTPGDNPCTGGATTNCDDNCVRTPNANQADGDSDGVGDVCDADIDGDGVSNDDEDSYGSDPEDADSTPEALGWDWVTGADSCTDSLDNDGDGLTDSDDPGCQGGAFEPEATIDLSSYDSGDNADITTTFLVDAPDVNFDALVTFTPSECEGGLPGFYVATDADVPDGTVVGSLTSSSTLSTVLDYCNHTLPVEFTLVDATTDIDNDFTSTGDIVTGTWNGFDPVCPGGVADRAVCEYPDFLLELFPGLEPRARYYGKTFVPYGFNIWQVITILVFEPGDCPSGYNCPADWGYPSVTVLNDPTVPPAPSALGDYCTPTSRESTILGLADGIPVRTNPPYESTCIFRSWSRGLPDADGDGYENSFDTCPFDPDPAEEDPRQNRGPDGDAINSSCDPQPAVNNGTDADMDGYGNNADNCPLDSNFDQEDADGDGIGEVCDTEGNGPDVMDGVRPEVTMEMEVDIIGPAPGPPNDDFPGSPIPALPYSDAQYTCGATAEPGEPNCGCASIENTVWYNYTAGAQVRLEANTFGSDYDTQLMVYGGPDPAIASFDDLSCVGCNDDTDGPQSRVTFTAEAGTTYYFQIDGWAGACGDLVFSVYVAPPPLQIDLSIDPVGAVVPETGVATIGGTVTCTKPAFVDLFGELRQRAGRSIIVGSFYTFLPCDGETPWSVTVASETGRYAGGRADVSAGAFAFADGEFDSADASATVQLRGSRPPKLCPRGGNDGFEAGVVDTNVIPCWTVVDQEGGYGSWCNQTGTTPPQGPCAGSFTPVAAPPEGLQAAMTNQSGPGSHAFYRCGTLRSELVSFELYINNEAWAFSSPSSLDYLVDPNQQFRADLVTAAGMAADPFTVAPADILLNIYQTVPGDALVSGYTTVTADVSAYVGQNVCLRFAEVENQWFFHAGVDAVNIDLVERGRTRGSR